jgi:RNA polymerase primary sigma factor
MVIMAKAAKQVSKKSPKATKKVAKKASGEVYKGHRAGSLKGKLHKIFDTIKDPVAAKKAALKLPVNPSTVQTSFYQFRRALRDAKGGSKKSAKRAPAKKASAKKSTKRAPAKKAA